MEVAVYLGRFSPLHKGHQKIIDRLIQKYGYQNFILMVGSSNKKNIKTPFSYRQRNKFIKLIYPNLKIIPIPDFDNDTKWLDYLKGIEVKLKSEFIFFGGSKKDLEILQKRFTTRVLVNRAIEGGGISATQVRHALEAGDIETLKRIVSKKLVPLLKEVL